MHVGSGELFGAKCEYGLIGYSYWIAFLGYLVDYNTLCLLNLLSSLCGSLRKREIEKFSDY